MKKLARKFLAMLLTAAIAVSGLVVTTVTAAAESIADKAIEIEPMELVSRNFENEGDSEYYKIVLPKDGDVTLRFEDSSSYIHWRLLDGGGADVASSQGNMWERTNAKYDLEGLKKGTYYIMVSAGVDNTFIKGLNYSFTPAQKAAISISATLKKGDTLQLGSVTENYDGKVTWLSTKKTIATVSDKGLVTAKKAGTTYIRAQLDNGDYVEIKVVVKKK